MSVCYYLLYHGVKYDVGTKLKLRYRWYGGEWRYITGVITFFDYCKFYVDCGESFPREIRQPCVGGSPEEEIVEIIEPVYYIESPQPKRNNRDCPPDWKVKEGWIWYIIIMVIGTLFYARWIIWIFATLYFFLWKNGFLNGGKK